MRLTATLPEDLVCSIGVEELRVRQELEVELGEKKEVALAAKSRKGGKPTESGDSSHSVSIIDMA
jgi:hypothetical protein